MTCIAISPNKVQHLVLRGRCITCGHGDHKDWERHPIKVGRE